MSTMANATGCCVRLARRRDSALEQRYNFFKDTVYHNLWVISDNAELIKIAKLDI